YFAAGIWPFMGIFLHAIDARTGKVVWSNDGDSCIFIKQPHNADSFAGVAPQGPLAVAGDKLLVPGGRSVPACFDRKTGKLLRFLLAENGKRGGGSDVAAKGSFFFNGGAAFDLESANYLGEIGKQVVLSPDGLFTYSAGSCRAYNFKPSRESEDANGCKGKVDKGPRWPFEELASCKTAPVENLIQ